MTNFSEEELKRQRSEMARQLGIRGGAAVKKKYGTDYFVRISKLGKVARWGKKSSASPDASSST